MTASAEVRIKRMRRGFASGFAAVAASPIVSCAAALNFWQARHDTMVFAADLIGNLLLVREALAHPNLEHGAIIECGTCRGGMAAALVVAGGDSRRYYFFYSFAGLPPPIFPS